MIVYKYLHPKGVDVLSSSLIRFTQPAGLNDPFEVTPNLRELRQYIARATTGYDPQTTQQIITDTFGRWNEDNVSKLVFLCVSENRNSLLMWSHYCDSHRGFVIGFDSTHPFFGSPTHGKGVLKRVAYSSARPILPAPDDPRLDEFERESVNILTKSEHWKYEKELRMCASPIAADDTQPGADGQPLYRFRFPAESVVELILGCRMSEKYREAIVEIVRDRYRNARLYKTALSESEYDLDVVPYD